MKTDSRKKLSLRSRQTGLSFWQLETVESDNLTAVFTCSDKQEITKGVCNWLHERWRYRNKVNQWLCSRYLKVVQSLNGREIKAVFRYECILQKSFELKTDLLYAAATKDKLFIRTVFLQWELFWDKSGMFTYRVACVTSFLWEHHFPISSIFKLLD